MPSDLLATSPYGIWAAHCARGELAYQVAEDGSAVFFPRVVAPGSGGPLEWRVSAGLGTVYATTVLRHRGEPPLNLALIDLDEGFRMMSRVEGRDPAQVRIGDRVRVTFLPGTGDAPPLPVFVPVDADHG